MSEEHSEGSQEQLPIIKTPLYVAANSVRYERQARIDQIQQISETQLICYISGNGTHISRDDVVPFNDLLTNIPKNTSVDLLLHTGGGDIDPVEKIINMLWDRVGTGTFRIIVPDYAKSAGTLMVLAADRVVMSDSSELGPIDPQAPHVDSSGQSAWLSTQRYIDAYLELSEQLKHNPTDVAALTMLQKLDYTIYQHYEAINDRARQLAERFLMFGMFAGGQRNVTATAKELLDTARWRTHSQVISWNDAKNPPIELEVEYMDPQDDLWRMYWQLYCMQRLAVSDGQKLFESAIVSYPI